MRIRKRRILLLAATVSAVIGTGFATRSRGRHQRATYDAQYKSSLRIWENEGGSVPLIRASDHKDLRVGPLASFQKKVAPLAIF